MQFLRQILFVALNYINFTLETYYSNNIKNMKKLIYSIIGSALIVPVAQAGTEYIPEPSVSSLPDERLTACNPTGSLVLPQ